VASNFRFAGLVRRRYSFFMSALRDSIIQKIDALPEPALRQVLDFVSFLAWKGADGEQSVLAVAGQLSGAPMSAHEIEQALYGQDRQGSK